MTSLAQTKAIHALRRQIEGMDEDAYRGLLQNKFRVASSRDLDDRQAANLIDDLKRRVGQHLGRSGTPALGRAACETATGKYAPALQALWITAYNLGLAFSKDDKALLKFVQRQTRVSHTRFLTDPHLASKAIEGLKKWLARDADVEWPAEGLSDHLAVKQAVVRAIAARLVACGGFEPFVAGTSGWPSNFEQYGSSRSLPNSFEYYTAADWDQLANWLGARLRAALASQRKGAGI